MLGASTYEVLLASNRQRSWVPAKFRVQPAQNLDASHPARSMRNRQRWSKLREWLTAGSPQS